MEWFNDYLFDWDEVWFWGWIALGVLLGLTLIWYIIKSIKIIGPTEMGVKVFAGKPYKDCDSGWYIILYGLEKYLWDLRIFSKRIFNFPYKEHKVISMATEYHGAYYGALPVKVDSVVYIGFPRERDTKSHKMTFLETIITTDGNGVKSVKEEVIERISEPLDKKDGPHPLIEILKSGIPTDEEGLKDWTEEVVVNAVRIALGKISWKEATEDMRKANKNIAFVFKDPESALHKVGFRDEWIQIIIQDIKIPQEIEDALPGVDKARLKKDAAKDVAETEAIEIADAIIGMMARSRGKNFAQMQASIEADGELGKEFWKFFQKQMERKMAIDGNAFMEFSFPGLEKGGIEQAVLSILTMLRQGGGSADYAKNSGKVDGAGGTGKAGEPRPFGFEK